MYYSMAGNVWALYTGDAEKGILFVLWEESPLIFFLSVLIYNWLHRQQTTSAAYCFIEISQPAGRARLQGICIHECPRIEDPHLKC